MLNSIHHKYACVLDQVKGIQPRPESIGWIPALKANPAKGSTLKHPQLRGIDRGNQPQMVTSSVWIRSSSTSGRSMVSNAGAQQWPCKWNQWSASVGHVAVSIQWPRAGSGLAGATTLPPRREASFPLLQIVDQVSQVVEHRVGPTLSCSGQLNQPFGQFSQRRSACRVSHVCQCYVMSTGACASLSTRKVYSNQYIRVTLSAYPSVSPWALAWPFLLRS